MTISEVQAVQTASRESGAANGAERAARNRELRDAVRAINEGGGVGPNSELQFAIDQGTGQPLIRIVDRVTDEVITQFPAETLLRAAEVLKSLQPGDRIA